MSRTVSIIVLAGAVLMSPAATGSDVSADPAAVSTKGEANMDCDRVRGDEAAIAGIEETFRAWAEALRVQDLADLRGLVTEDAEFWTHSRPPLVGRSALASSFESLFARGELEQEFDCRELIVAGDWAFVRGTERNVFTSAGEGEEPVEVEQRAFSVLHRDREGTWRFARGMTNLPPGEAS